MALETDLVGVGFYTAADAARLLRTPVRNINRWLGGYKYKHAGEVRRMPPLWAPQLPRSETNLELGFRDLIELRFVVAFMKEGVDLQIVRRCLDLARQVVSDERPFSTRRFLTDGKTIFLESIAADANDGELLDLKRRQYVIKRVIQQTLTDLDIEADAVARWRPFHGRRAVVVDPMRSFGKPILTEYGVPTAAIIAAVEAEESAARAAALFKMPVRAVNEAVRFEQYLQAA